VTPATGKSTMKRLIAGLALLVSAVPAARADVKLPGPFGDHMVLQRDRAVPVYGTAAPGEKVTVAFGGQTLAATADARGAWRVDLAPMPASATGQGLKVSASNTVSFNDVLVGDVWICSGQSNMDMRLGGCKRPEDVASASFPGIRHFASPGGGADEPLREPRGDPKWVVCAPGTASHFTAAGFYFARKLQQELNWAVPVGLMLASVGGTKIDLWLAPEGLVDIPVLHPLLKHRPLADGTFSLFNGMVAPLAPYAARGVLWYQGENSEVTVQSPDSYYLKMKALIEGWKRVWGQDDMAFYFVMLANYGDLLKTEVPVLRSGGWDADTRLQQAMAMALPHAGCASAMDIGISKVSWAGYHPENKLDVGERLALWALKNEHGRAGLVTSGPVLRNAALAGGAVVCTFDHVGGGLMAGSKAWYEPTKEVPGGTLRRFCIAGADGTWVAADAVIKGVTVVLSSPAVPAPRKVSYACWQNPEGANLYNKEGLPAAPFHVEDVTVQHTITASAGPGGRITPAGAAAYPPRATALYAVTPDAGYSIQDVTVDGVSVGSVREYTFDPLQKDHAIAATFAKTAPSYTVTASATGGGRITPSGTVTVAQGGTARFAVEPGPGNRVTLSVDGVAIGARERIALPDVRASHTIQAAFACTIRATAGFGGTLSPSGEQIVPYGGDRSFTITPNPGYSVARVLVDGRDAGTPAARAFTNVTASHTIHVQFKGGDAVAGRIPRPEDLLVAVRADVLPDVGEIREWPAQVPAGKALKPIGRPAVEMIDGTKYARIVREQGDGFTAGTFSEPVPCAGASVVAVARPVRNGSASGWVSVVDVFYDRLVLGILGDTGKVCVRRNGGVETSEAAIHDGQVTILSLVVQPDGAYKAYANGTEILSRKGGNAMTALAPGKAGPFAHQITLGRNAPDGWTTFNGQIGDVFLYKAALTDAERKQLEAFVAKGLEGEK
jgi:sialate O-acetylesterase